MKKKFVTLFLIILMALCPIYAHAEDKINYKAAVLIDYNSGKVLYDKNMDKVLPEASITKLMTYYVIMDYLKKDKIDENTIVKIDSNINVDLEDASGVGLKKGQQFKVSELISSMLIASANDSAEALKSFYEKSGGDFIAAMNSKTEKLGLKNTLFVNATGLTEGGNPVKLNKTTAYDIALLSKYVIKDYPQILQITKKSGITINGRFYSSTNGTLKFNNIIDGLKTGHTKEAGYCLDATLEVKGNKNNKNIPPGEAVTDDMRLISVVFGCETDEERVKESLSLLDYGEKNYSCQRVIDRNDKLITYNELYNGGIIYVHPYEDYFLLKNKSDSYKKVVVLNDKLPYRIKKGDLIGKIQLVANDGSIKYTCSAISEGNYKEVNIFKRFYIFFKRIISSIEYKLK